MDAIAQWVLVVGLMALVVFLVLREFWTWYWKQSEQVALLKSIDARLARLAPDPPTPAPQAGEYATAPWARSEAETHAAWQRVFDPQPRR